MSDPSSAPTAGPEPHAGVPARWAFWGVAAAVFLGGLALWTPFPAGVWHDDGVYMMLGRALARGEGLRYLGVSGAPPAPKFPPLYPAALAGVWAVGGEIARANAGAQLLNLALLAAAAGLFARYLHRSLSIAPGWAAGIAALGWLAGGLWRVALIPLSEPLFIFFLVVGLVAAARLEARVDDRWALAAFLAAFALAVHTRTAGVALAAGVVFVLLLRGARRTAAILAGGAVAVMLPWALWSRTAAREIPGSLQDVLGPYMPWLLDQIAADPALFMSSLRTEAVVLVDRVLTVLVPQVPPWEPWLDPGRWGALVVLLPAFLLGMDRVWSRARAPILVLVAYLGVVWIWPFRDPRLVAPAIPLLILVVVEGFRWRGEGAEPLASDAGEGDAGPRGPERQGVSARAVRAWRGAGIVWAVAYAGASIWGLVAGWPGAGYEIRTSALVRAAEAVDETTPADAVVGAPELWAGLHLYTGRTVVPSAPFRALDRDAPTWGAPADQYALWAAGGMDHLLVEHGGRVHRDALDRLEARCGQDALRVLASWPGSVLVRLTWDDDCRRALREGAPERD